MSRLATAALLLALPAVASAASEGASQVWEAVNLALLLVVLFFLTRRPIAAFLAERRTRIQEELAGAESLLRDAEARLGEWSAKVERLETDAEEIRRVSRHRAEEERTRILEDAARGAERIRRDASAAIDRELRRARQTLRDEAADLAVKLAEERLRESVTDADRARLVDEFVTRIASEPRAD